MKENINNNFEKLIPKKAVIEPSFENSLLAFKYSSIAKKEQKEKTKILEAEKNRLRLMCVQSAVTDACRRWKASRKKSLLQTSSSF